MGSRKQNESGEDKKIRDSDTTGLNYFDQLSPLLKRLDDDGGGGNTVKTLNLNHSVTLVYDALGRTTSTTSFAGTTSTSYNSSNGRVVSQTDASG
jgi:YD repeat-containing protein